MNFIDISSWQKGIDLSVLFAENPLDGVIVKATEGTGYVNPEFVGWAEWLIAHNKPIGLYHFCDGVDAEAEAKHFYDNVRSYIGKATLWADYESPATDKGTGWLKRFVDAFESLSGVRLGIYCSLSVIRSQDFSGLVEHPLWLAQYADMNPTGFVNQPWQSGSVAPFDGYIMQQYTSNGVLSGWDGRLDLDKFFGTADHWNALLSEKQPETLKPADPVIVSAVLANEYGTGSERNRLLRAAGYDPASVQAKINELYAVALSCKKKCDGNLEYLNSITKLIRLL